MKNLITILKNFGLSDKEAKIYLALLELEASKVSEVAKHSGINRSSAYVVLEILRKRGLVGISDDKKIRRYIAASPEVLLQIARTTAHKHQSVKEDIESVLPEFKALAKGTKRKPIVKVFEGENGAREVYWDLFSTKAKDLRTVANPINIFERIPDFMVHDKERGRRGIKIYAINPASKEMLELHKHANPHKPYEQLFIPENKFKFSSDMGIYDNKVAFVSPADNFGIIIESRELASMFKDIFDLAWEEAKRLDKKIKK